MKWPKSLTIIRHDTSLYNDLKIKKRANEAYQEFLKEFRKNPDSYESQMFAYMAQKEFALNLGDHETPLAQSAGHQAIKTGEKIKEVIDLPDVIFVSPYDRTLHTLENLVKGWPELADVETYEDERIREREHGLALLYNDWRVFHVLHPDQRHLYKLEGPYWYRYPQGENIPDVRLRARSIIETCIREFSEKNVLFVTHHETILSIRANLERLDANEFMRIDKKEKHINCGVTHYKGNPNAGKNGKLKLDFYNKRFY